MSNGNFVSSLCVAFASLGILSGCSALQSQMKNHDPVGVWEVVEFKTRRVGISADVSRELLLPLKGARIYSYRDGLAELHLEDGRSSCGYIFTNTPGKTVEFFFDEGITDLLERLYLPCKFRDARLLLVDDGMDVLRLRKMGSVPSGPSEKLRKKLPMAQDARARLKLLLSEAEDDCLDTPSNDGKAFLPGIQGK